MSRLFLPRNCGWKRPARFLGPTGVGKTELAKALAEELFDDESHMVRLAPTPPPSARCRTIAPPLPPQRQRPGMDRLSVPRR
jgi:hypothetical protein